MVNPTPPRSWKYYQEAFCSLYFSPNFVSTLVRGLMSLMFEEWTPKVVQPVDKFAIEVTRAFEIFQDKAECSHSARQDSSDYAWEMLMIAFFESGLSPAVRLGWCAEIFY